MQDDIDWLNASTDFGLIQLCREMAAMAHPLESLTGKPRKRIRRAQPATRLARARLA